MKVIGIGDNIVDKFLDRRVYYPGGNSVNFAVFARQCGAEASYLGVFGTDALARSIKDALEDCDVDYSLSPEVEGETGWASVNVEGGDRVFVEWNEGGVTRSHPLVLDEAQLAHVSTFDLAHLGVYGEVASQVHRIAELGPVVVYDFSAEEEFRTDEYIGALAPHLDFAQFSCAELGDEGIESLLRRVVDAGAGVALATRGSDGSVLFDGTRFYRQDATTVENPLDTMGCGDAFLASVTTSFLKEGWQRGQRPAPTTITRALEEAAAFAARQCLTEGAFEHGQGF